MSKPKIHPEALDAATRIRNHPNAYIHPMSIEGCAEIISVCYEPTFIRIRSGFELWNHQVESGELVDACKATNDRNFHTMLGIFFGVVVGAGITLLMTGLLFHE